VKNVKMILDPSGDQPGLKAKERLPPVCSGIARRPVPPVLTT
jgi:hypothetical protein